jgi:hypothetical protein
LGEANLIQEILIAILSVTLVLSLYYNYKFARVILRVEDAIEDSLDDLNQRYQVMSEILQRPVFFDSVEVRKVIAEIGDSRDSILRAASRISSVDGRKE